MRAVSSPSLPCRRSTLPRRARATRRGSRAKKARSKAVMVVFVGPGRFSMDRNMNGHRLDWLGLGVSGGGYVGGIVVEAFARFVGSLLVLGADFADRIVPAIVPGDAGFAIYHGPCAVAWAYRLLGLAAGFQ